MISAWRVGKNIYFSTLHNDLGIPFIKDVLKERCTKYHDRLEAHPNTLLQPLLEKVKQPKAKTTRTDRPQMKQ